MIRKNDLVRIGKNKRVFRVAVAARPSSNGQFYLEADADHPGAAKRLGDAFRWYDAAELTFVCHGKDVPRPAATPDPSKLAATVAEHLAAHTYQWSKESDLQETMGELLRAEFVDVRREVTLSDRDRPDFVVELSGFRIAIEVKVAGSRNAVMRQVGRYAEHDSIDALVFASTRRALLAGFPDQLHGKPIAVALLAGAL